MYIIILFKNEQRVAIVPKSWLGDNLVVNWPLCSASTRIRLCRKGAVYEGATDPLPIEILGFADTYTDALVKERHAVKQSLYSSHDDTVAMRQRPRRHIKRPKRLTESTSESSEYSTSNSTDDDRPKCKVPSRATSMFDVNLPIPPPPPTKCTPLLHSTMLASTSNRETPTASAFRSVALDKDLMGPLAVDCSINATSPSTSQSTPLIPSRGLYQPMPVVSDAAYQSLMAHQIEFRESVRGDLQRHFDLFRDFTNNVNQRLRTIEAKVDRCCTQTGTALRVDRVNLPIPIKTNEEFVHMEGLLQSESSANEFKAALSQVSGHSLGQFLRNALCRILTINLARTMNVSGLNGRLGLKGTNLLRLMKTFLNNDPRFVGYQEREVHQIIRDWLHNSKVRGSIEVRCSEPRQKQHDPANVDRTL